MTIPELTLTGSPRDRGRAHGEEFRDLIESGIGAWFEHLAPKTDPEKLTADLLHVSGLRQAVEQHAPELLDEVRGISEGSTQSVEAMFAWQLIDEAWWYLDEQTGSLEMAEHCSAMAINQGGRGIVAQTQDLPLHYNGQQIMLRYIEQDGLEVLAPSLAGLLALNGVNSAGLGVCITTLSELPHSGQGVASGFLIPMLMRCRSIDEALQLLDHTPIASGNSFTLGTRDRSVVVEASADGVTVAFDGERAIHTNHVLACEPTWAYSTRAGSESRLAQLDAAVQPTSNVEDIAAMYGNAPVCSSLDSGATHVSIGTMIFELNDTQICHYAPGPLDAAELVAYQMS